MKTQREIPFVSGATGPLGHAAELRQDLFGLLGRLGRECGDIGRLRFGWNSLVAVNSPELVAELLVDHHARLRKSRFIRASLSLLVGEGLFTSDGELWRRQRKLMAPIFHASKMAEFDACMTGCASRCVATWRDGAVIDIAAEATRITMAVAAQSLFGADTFEQSEAIGADLDVALRWASRVSTSVPLALQIELADTLDQLAHRAPPAPRRALGRAAAALDRPILWPTRDNRQVQTAIARLDARVAEMIAARRAARGDAGAPAREDLLSRLLHARDAVEGAMSDAQLRDEVLTLFVAGHETTATALAWAFYLLGRAPAVLARLVREIDALEGRTPRAADLARLPLATRVFKEALRLYPPVPIYERQVLEPFELAGYRLERGAYVGLFPWTLHHRPSLWPEPGRFDPDRFEPAAEQARPRYAWVPFGAGPRVCIGLHFALQEGPLVLATILQRARLEPVDDRTIPIDPYSPTARPRGGVPMRVALRSGPRATRGADAS